MAAKKSKGKSAAAVRKRASASPATDGTGPRLLSGGNPQIAKADGNEPVQAYIAAMPGWKHEIGAHLDELIERLVSDVRKAVRWNTPFYGVPGSGWFLSFHCLANYVKVTFHNGARLRPRPPEESKNEAIRYLHLHEGESVETEQIKEWIRSSAALPGEELF